MTAWISPRKVVITEAGGAITDLDGYDIDVDLGECLSPKVVNKRL